MDPSKPPFRQTMMFSSIGKFLLTASLYLISRQNFMVISLKDFSPAYPAITTNITQSTDTRSKNCYNWYYSSGKYLTSTLSSDPLMLVSIKFLSTCDIVGWLDGDSWTISSQAQYHTMPDNPATHTGYFNQGGQSCAKSVSGLKWALYLEVRLITQWKREKEAGNLVSNLQLILATWRIKHLSQNNSVYPLILC